METTVNEKMGMTGNLLQRVGFSIIWTVNGKQQPAYDVHVRLSQKWNEHLPIKMPCEVLIVCYARIGNI